MHLLQITLKPKGAGCKPGLPAAHLRQLPRDRVDFERLIPMPVDGRDLNPLLQDPGMIIHPPLLYMGYVGFSVVFAFAIAALLGGKLDATWARWSRPWTTVAWMFLRREFGKAEPSALPAVAMATAE